MITLLKAFVAAAEANGLDYETAVTKANACAQLRGLDGEHATSIAKACGAECAAIELDAVSPDDKWVTVCHRHKHRHGTLRKHWQEIWPSAPRCGCQIRYAKTGARKSASRMERMESRLLELVKSFEESKHPRDSHGRFGDSELFGNAAHKADVERDIQQDLAELTNWKKSLEKDGDQWLWTISDQDDNVIRDGFAPTRDDAVSDGEKAFGEERDAIHAELRAESDKREANYDAVYKAAIELGAEDGEAAEIAERVEGSRKMLSAFKKSGAEFLSKYVSKSHVAIEKRYVSEASLKGGWEKATPPDGMPASKPGKGKSKLWWAKPRRKKPETAKPIHEKTLDEHTADKRKDWETANAKRTMTPEEKRKALLGVDVNAAAEHRKAVASAKRKGVSVRDDVAASVKAVPPKPKSEKIEEPNAQLRSGDTKPLHQMTIGEAFKSGVDYNDWYNAVTDAFRNEVTAEDDPIYHSLPKDLQTGTDYKRAQRLMGQPVVDQRGREYTLAGVAQDLSHVVLEDGAGGKSIHSMSNVQSVSGYVDSYIGDAKDGSLHPGSAERIAPYLAREVIAVGGDVSAAMKQRGVDPTSRGGIVLRDAVARHVEKLKAENAQDVDPSHEQDVQRGREADEKFRGEGRYESEVWQKLKRNHPGAKLPRLSRDAAEWTADEYERDGKPIPPEVLVDHPDLAVKYGPKDGDRNADGLVFRNGRWHRDEELSAQLRSAFTPSAITDVSATERKTVSWAWFGDVAKGIREGAISADDLRAQFESLVGNRDAVIDSLSAALKKTGLRSKDKIAENARHMFDRALNLLTPGVDSIQYAMSLEPGGFEKAKIDAYRKAVNGITNEHLAAHREKVAATVAAREKSLSNPETLDEFEKFISARGEPAMTPAQRAAYDSLYAERRRENDRKRESHRAYVAPTGSHDYEIHEGIHTKHNKPIFIVKLNNRVGSDTFKDLATKARQLRGNWQSNSRYSGGKTPDGFNFDSREDAERFGSLLSGTGVSRAEDWEESRQLSAQSSAQRLREMADRVEERSRESLGRDRLANTHRRAEHAASAEAEAQAGIAWSSTARNIADGVESGSLKHLGGIRHGTHIDELGIAARRSQYARQRGENRYQEGEPISVTDADHAKYPYPYFDKSDLLRLSSTMRDTPGAKRVGERVRKFANKMGDDGAYLSDESFLKDMGDIAKNPSAYGLDKWQSMSVKGKMNSYMRLQSADIKDVRELRAALREYIPLMGGAEEDSTQQKIKKMERSLIGRKIPGFFPTPRHIVDQMISTADIQPGMSVLEPSAGKGDILDAVRESVPDADTHGVEINGDLRAIIEAKGHNLAGHDFTEHSGQYDRILMNPPFESGQDAEHVQRAYDMLKPGGRLVAIMSEGPFFRGDKKSSAFRDWLDNVGGDSEKLPEDSFGGSDAFRQTGVNTRMVTITKPA